MKKLFLLTAFGALFLINSIQAQETRTITLQEAIDLALDNNYLLKQAENNLELSDKRILSEKADFLPSVSSSMRYSKTTGRQFVQETLSFTDVTSSSTSGSISASMPIFNGFNNILTLRASESGQNSSEENFNRTRENVIFDTASRYLRVLLDMQLLEDAKENLETTLKQLDQTKAQVEVGSRPNVDLYNQEATVANAELTITQRENALKLSKLQLVRSLQVDPLVNYEFVVPNFDPEAVKSSPVANYDARDLIEEALLNRSDLKSAEYNLESLKYQLQIAKGSLLPTVSANASVSSGYSDQYRLGGQDVSFSDQFFDQRVNKSLGISLSLPIFNNWNRMYNIQSSQVSLKNAELGLENTKLQIIQEITQAFNDFTSLTAQLEAAEKSLVASERAFATQQERYNVGASTLIELSQAQNQYLQAQSSRTSALYNLIFQEKLLDYYLGKLTGEDVRFD
jgi:outer membrane protein